MKKSIEIKRTAHYWIQKPDLPIRSILFAIHGYAQLANDFLNDFRLLKNSNVLVITPEGLSKFYNKERKPVASWMTSHEREDEIKNYIDYLNQLYSTISNDYPHLPTNVLGFSQGVSTLLRWISNSSIKPSTVHLCSGTIPPELTKESFETLNDSNFIYYYGSEDRLLKEDAALKQIRLLGSFDLKVKSAHFSGRHEIPQECLENLMA